jgi:hypothetical protein
MKIARRHYHGNVICVQGECRHAPSRGDNVIATAAWNQSSVRGKAKKRNKSFLVLFFKKEQKKRLLFEKRSKNFCSLAPNVDVAPEFGNASESSRLSDGRRGAPWWTGGGRWRMIAADRPYSTSCPAGPFEHDTRPGAPAPGLDLAAPRGQRGS